MRLSLAPLAFFLSDPPNPSIVQEAPGSNPNHLYMAEAEQWRVEICTNLASPPKGAVVANTSNKCMPVKRTPAVLMIARLLLTLGIRKGIFLPLRHSGICALR